MKVDGGRGGWRGESIEIHFDNTTKYYCNIHNAFGVIFATKVKIDPKLCDLRLI